MKKTIVAFLCIILVILPFAAISYTAFGKIPAQYDETFMGEFSQKHELLKTVEGPRIVLVGGSNLAFGVDSELLEKYTELPVVNYGLYANLGTKVMLDMSQKYIRNGDIVIICPEMNEQTYSLYYNADSILQAYDSDPSMIYDAKITNAGKLFGALPSFASNKLSFYQSGKKPSSAGIYAKESFDEFGDIYVERKFNEMRSDYDTAMPINISTDIIGDGFVNYLNNYAKKAQDKGAQVYFSFSPMNARAVKSDDVSKEEFYRYLGENLDFPIISDIDDYILESAYFYDTNFHLNTRGAKLRTALLADDIRRACGMTDYVETIKYSAIERPEDYFAEDKKADENSKYFTYEKTASGLIITGLTDEGKNQKTLIVPNNSDGTAVTELSGGALAQSGVLEVFVIPETSKLGTIGEKAFDGCKKLRRIELYLLPDMISAHAEAFEGMASGCYIYVPEENFGVFTGDYFWGGRMKYVRMIGE